MHFFEPAKVGLSPVVPEMSGSVPIATVPDPAAPDPHPYAGNDPGSKQNRPGNLAVKINDSGKQEKKGKGIGRQVADIPV